MKYIYPCLVLFLISCTDTVKKNTEDISADTLESKSDSTVIIDVDTTKQDNTTEDISVLSLDSLSYIGFVNKFYNQPNEIYIDAYFKEDSMAYDEYEQIAKLADSIIFQDDENKRAAMDLNTAAQYFDLKGLGAIQIFDQKNQYITSAKLAQVEYLDQNIESFFAATYRLPKPLEDNKIYYCISESGGKVVMDNYYKKVVRPVISDSLVAKYNVNQEYIYENKRAFHFENDKTKHLVSIINANEYALIFSDKIDSNYIYKSTESETIVDVHIIPIDIHGLPIILTQSFMPESDVGWSSLLVFDGNRYNSRARQKVKIELETIE